jgi:DNA-binding MarR family transcriptional regulator
MSDSQDSLHELNHLLLTLRSLCARKDQLITRHMGFSTSELNALSLDWPEQGLSLKDFALALKVTQGGASRIAEGLVGRGLLRRMVSPKDRRGIRLTLSSPGTRTARALSAMNHHIHRSIFHSFDEAQRAQTVQGLQHLVTALNLWLDQSPLPLPSIASESDGEPHA